MNLLENLYMIGNATLLITVILFLGGLFLYYIIEKRKDKNFSIFGMRKPLLSAVNDKEMLKLQRLLESLPLEQRVWLLKNLIGRPCRIFLSADKQGLYIDSVSIHESFLDLDPRDNITG